MCAWRRFQAQEKYCFFLLQRKTLFDLFATKQGTATLFLSQQLGTVPDANYVDTGLLMLAVTCHSMIMPLKLAPRQKVQQLMSCGAVFFLNFPLKDPSFCRKREQSTFNLLQVHQFNQWRSAVGGASFAYMAALHAEVGRHCWLACFFAAVQKCCSF
ncbi:hypothetical protein COO60DRAFT_118068 [Scenedesmus sp. NREL 46B-D3]|nr:hypothetical protein COO60DRAFT_118068 [Scenedesmus sp. NREL 46B-D3]